MQHQAMLSPLWVRPSNTWREFEDDKIKVHVRKKTTAMRTKIGEEDKNIKVGERKGERQRDRVSLACHRGEILGGFCCFEVSLLVDSRIKQHGYGKLIVSMAYLQLSPPQSNKQTSSNRKRGNTQHQTTKNSSIFGINATVV